MTDKNAYKFCGNGRWKRGIWYACRTVGVRLTRFGSADWHRKKFVYDIVFESVLFGSHPKEKKQCYLKTIWINR